METADVDLSHYNDGDLAAMLAQQAGQHLLSLRAARFAQCASGGEPLDAAQLKALGDDGDRTSNDLIVGSLKKLRPLDAILSEESTDDLARLDADRVWIVDPLDGTREYKIDGNPEWAVHIALWERFETSGRVASKAPEHAEPHNAGRLTLGVVGLPVLGLVLRSDQPVSPMSATPGRLRLVRSGSRPQPLASGVALLLGADELSMGSAGAKAMAIVRGEADVYLHTGGQWEWDSAAPVIVAQGHGLFVARVDGSPMLYNQRDTFLPDLVICRADLADQVMAAVRQVLVANASVLPAP
jgi:3'(2'), 5'-bisphosphate nucleotidase